MFFFHNFLKLVSLRFSQDFSSTCVWPIVCKSRFSSDFIGGGYVGQTGNHEAPKIWQGQSQPGQGSATQCAKCRYLGFGSWVRISWSVSLLSSSCLTSSLWKSILDQKFAARAGFIWSQSKMWFVASYRFFSIWKPCVHVVPATLCWPFNLKIFLEKNFFCPLVGAT